MSHVMMVTGAADEAGLSKQEISYARQPANHLHGAMLETKLAVFEQIPAHTLARVQDAKQVKALGSRADGTLSDKQKHLIATVVSLMQDEITDELKGQRQTLLEELDSQRSAFVEWSRSAAVGLLSFARKGMFTSPKESQADERSLLSRVFTWGNFISGSAIVLVAIAGFTTHTYLAYKDLADVRTIERDSAVAAEGQQAAARATAEAKVESLSDQLTEKEKTIVKMRAQITVLKSQNELKEVKEESELQRQLSDALLSASVAQTAAERSRPVINRLKGQVATLNQLKKDLEADKKALRAENRQKSEVIDTLTKKLAKKATR